MASLLSSSDETLIQSLNTDLHDTFAKPITVYQNSQQVFVATSPQYNAIYGRVGVGSQPNVTDNTVSATYQARIYYIDSPEEYVDAKTSAKIIIPAGSVKIVVETEAFGFIKESRQIELDGKRFSIKSDGVPIGLTSNQFYKFILFPLDE